MESGVNTVYRMSEAGHCPRVLAARRLGYEEPPRSQEIENLLDDCLWHEERVVMRLRSEGWDITDRQREVSLSTPLLQLVGHIDGIASREDGRFLLEIKALGRFTFNSYIKGGILAFLDYAAQVTCYQKAIQLPILMAVKNRDTAVIKRDIMTSPPLSFERIVDSLNIAEQSVRNGSLPEWKCDERARERCPMSYLCGPGKAEVKELALPDLIEAARLWREGKELEREAEEKLGKARDAFLARAREEPSFTVEGLAVQYYGVRQRSYIDEVALRSLVPEETIKQAMRPGKPWDDLRVRERKQE